MGDVVRDAYDLVAQNYSELLPDCSFEASLDLAVVKHFVDALSGADVLDAGCGSGRMMTHLPGLDDTLGVRGVDLSPEMVRHARIAHLTLPIAEGDLRRLPFQDNVFDGVLSWYSIIHIHPDDLHLPISEMRRVLKPGGHVLIGFRAGEGQSRQITRAYGHDLELTAYVHSVADVESTLRAADFAPVVILERAPRATDRHRQGFVIATTVDYAGPSK